MNKKYTNESNFNKTFFELTIIKTQTRIRHPTMFNCKQIITY